VVTDPPTQKPRHRQGRLQYTAPQLSAQCNDAMCKATPLESLPVCSRRLTSRMRLPNTTYQQEARFGKAKLLHVKHGHCLGGRLCRHIISHPCQLSLAIPPWVGAMSTNICKFVALAASHRHNGNSILLCPTPRRGVLSNDAV